MPGRFAANRVRILMLGVALVGLAVGALGMVALAQARDDDDAGDAPFTDSYDLAGCTWETTGRNSYFSLEPGTRHVLAGVEEGEAVRMEATVLEQLEEVAGVTTRVLEERHFRDGELDEVSYNYVAMCRELSSVFYFGEAVDYYHQGQIVGHEGAWRARENGALPGLYMPALPLLGARYYQETAPDAALDRAEVTSLTRAVTVPAGSFSGCLETVESTPLEPGVEDVKVYCPGVGIVIDAELQLVARTP